jgi:hypothetical protein
VWQPTSGRVLVDGVDLASMPTTTWRERTAMCHECGTPGCSAVARTPSSFGKARSSWTLRAERMRGIEPPYSAWEADVLPLNYIREQPRI